MMMWISWLEEPGSKSVRAYSCAQASLSTERMADSIRSNSACPQISGGANCTTALAAVVGSAVDAGLPHTWGNDAAVSVHSRRW